MLSSPTKPWFPGGVEYWGDGSATGVAVATPQLLGLKALLFWQAGYLERVKLTWNPEMTQPRG